MFTSDFINEVKDRIDLVDLISGYTELRQSSPYLYIGKCPNPSHKDSSPSFRVFKKGYRNGHKVNDYDTWACMGCHSGSKGAGNYGTDCFAFYQWMHNVSWVEAIKELCDRYGIPLPESKFDKELYAKKKQMESFENNLTHDAREYLYQRGLDNKDIEEWHIGYNGKIVFPLLDKYKNPIGFTKRWLQVPQGRNDKYHNSKSSDIFNKSGYLYGIHTLDKSFNEIRITEGPLDVVMANKYKVKNITATLGTAFTDDHVLLIKSIGKTPVLILDGDERGMIAAERAINKLAKADVYSKILMLPDGMDLCEFSLQMKYDTEDYINKNAMTYGQYIAGYLINCIDNGINEVKIKYYNDIKNLLETIPHEIERGIIREQIYNKFNIKV